MDGQDGDQSGSRTGPCCKHHRRLTVLSASPTDRPCYQHHGRYTVLPASRTIHRAVSITDDSLCCQHHRRQTVLSASPTIHRAVNITDDTLRYQHHGRYTALPATWRKDTNTLTRNCAISLRERLKVLSNDDITSPKQASAKKLCIIKSYS